MIIAPLINFIVAASAYWIFQKLNNYPVSPDMVWGILLGCVACIPVHRRE